MVDGRLSTVIWDFNGTLLDDLDLVVRTVNRQLEKQGLSLMTADTYREVFGFPVEEYYRRIGFDFEIRSMAELSADFFAEYEPKLRDCPLHSGVIEVLDAFEKSSVRQYVLSAMKEEMLRATLEILGIRDRFIAAYGLAHLEGDSKVSRGRDLLVDFDIDPATALMVGDTTHDAEVADELGMKVALVSGGHQSEPRLQATGKKVLCEVGDLLSELRM